MEWDPQLGQMRPLRHGLEVVHRLAGFDFDDRDDLLALFERVDDRVGVLFPAAASDRRVQLRAWVDADLDLALLQVLLEQSDHAVVFELLADGPNQNRAQSGLRRHLWT